jgi:hypothetical protein
MSKGQDAKKNVKKAPSKTPKEKKEAKRLKKAAKGCFTTHPFAPMRLACWIRSARASVVNIRTGKAAFRASALTAVNISMPFMFGMLISQITSAISVCAPIRSRP